MNNELISQQTFFAPAVINGYLEEQLNLFDLGNTANSFSPFVGVMATSIDDLYNEFLSSDGELPIFIHFEKLSRFRPSTFYRHKREQIMYNIHGPAEKVFGVTRVIQAALDREDSAAQDVNLWSSQNREKISGQTQFTQPIFFHRFKTLQIDETRDLLELTAVRSIYRTKIIVEYDYHTVDPLDALYT